MKSNIYKVLCICLLLNSLFFYPGNLMGQVPIVSFTAANGGSIQEGIGGVNMAVNIMNPNSNETTVEIHHMGTANYGEEYTINPDTIIFPAGSASPQLLNLHLLNDCIDEPNETIILKLANPTNGAQLGIATMTITLLDDDTQPLESCTYAVPSNIGVVTNSFSYSHHNGKFWVCQTGILTLRSTNNLALVESGGFVRAERDRNIIYVKAGGSAIVDEGDQNVIYAEDGSTVTIESGICNSIFAGSGVIYTDNGSGTIREDLSCAPLNIDYSQAPSQGCLISSVYDPVTKSDIIVFPNPTTGYVEIRHNDGKILQHVDLFDGHGQFMMTIPSNELTLSVPPGNYLLRCVFDNEIYCKRVVISGRTAFE